MKTPILYFGAPGIGKTAKVRSSFDMVEVVLLSAMTEEDIAGLPYREGKYELRTIPSFIRRLQDQPEDKSICLFLDEIDKARREVADTLLTLITHPASFGLPERVNIIAAANPPEWGGGDGLSQAMMSRFAVIEATPQFVEFESFILNKYEKVRWVTRLCKMIETGKLPLLEQVGEGFTWRLSCPRTYDLAIQSIIDKQKDEVIYGLLTPNSASGILSLVRSYKEDDKVQDLARSVASGRSFLPVRV